MIGWLKGRVLLVAEDHLILDVGGVGYRVFCTSRTLARSAADAEASFFIETQVREDHIHLFGFAERAEQDWFRLLLTVQGVGARVALSILSVLAPAALADAISGGDKAALTQAGGVGARLAQRIVSELRDKTGAVDLGFAAGESPTGEGATAGMQADAVSALVNLGYRRPEAQAAVRRAGEHAALDTLIAAALKELAR